MRDRCVKRFIYASYLTIKKVCIARTLHTQHPLLVQYLFIYMHLTSVHMDWCNCNKLNFHSPVNIPIHTIMFFTELKHAIITTVILVILLIITTFSVALGVFIFTCTITAEPDTLGLVGENGIKIISTSIKCNRILYICKFIIIISFRERTNFRVDSEISGNFRSIPGQQG